MEHGGMPKGRRKSKGEDRQVKVLIYNLHARERCDRRDGRAESSSRATSDGIAGFIDETLTFGFFDEFIDAFRRLIC